jgi:WD40 repeat protein
LAHLSLIYDLLRKEIKYDFTVSHCFLHLLSKLESKVISILHNLKNTILKMKIVSINFESIFPILIILLQNKTISSQNIDDSLVHVLKPNKRINSLVNLPNGFLATASTDGLIFVWNIEDGYLVRTLKSSSSYDIKSLAILQSGLMVSGSYDGIIDIWNPIEFYIKASQKISDSEILLLADLKDGLIAIGLIFDVVIFNSFTGEIVKQMPIFLVQSLVALDKNLLATSSLISVDISVWNVTSEEIIFNLVGHTNLVSTLITLPNGFLASGSDDNTIKIWDSYTFSLVKSFKSDDYKITSMSALKNGLMVSTGENGWIKIWDPRNGIELKSFNAKTALYLLTVGSNGYLVSASIDEIFILNYEKFGYNRETQITMDLGELFN